jgi:hypothetical protein
MSRTTLVSIAGVTLFLSLLLVCVGPGLAVRAQLLDEIIFWLPPEGRYQVIVRIGKDAPPWNQGGGFRTAINVWAHDRQRARWHLISLIRVPFGGEPLPEQGGQIRFQPGQVP